MPDQIKQFNKYNTLKGVVIFLILCVTSLSLSASDEEFVGPFASWRDLKRDYGAAGDGKTNDSKALQRALNELTKHKKACVLYIPAGTYRLTVTVQTNRKEHTDCQGVAVIGEDPSSTILLWDGPADGTMLQWDAWYSKISRLAFDGRRQAGTGLLYGPAFSTYNETSDLVFRNMKNGLVFGGEKTKRNRGTNSKLELDGHLDLVLPIRGLRTRHFQRDGQLARMAQPLYTLTHRRCRHN